MVNACIGDGSNIHIHTYTHRNALRRGPLTCPRPPPPLTLTLTPHLPTSSPAPNPNPSPAHVLRRRQPLDDLRNGLQHPQQDTVMTETGHRAWVS